MMKKILALSLALLTLLSVASCAAKDSTQSGDFDRYKKEDVIYTEAVAENGDVFTFETVDSNTVTITGFRGDDKPHAVVIPSSVKTSDDAEAGIKTVASISDAAFYAKSSITSLTIPDTVVSIGDFAFAKCAQLTEISLSANLKTLGEGAFMDCVGLTKIVFPETSAMTALPEMAFSGCAALTEVTIPAYIATVGAGAFKNCASIEKIVLSEGVATVGEQAFKGTTALADLTLPATFTNTDPLEDLAFDGSTVLYLKNIHLPEGESAAKEYAGKMLLSEEEPE